MLESKQYTLISSALSFDTRYSTIIPINLTTHTTRNTANVYPTALPPRRVLDPSPKPQPLPLPSSNQPIISTQEAGFCMTSPRCLIRKKRRIETAVGWRRRVLFFSIYEQRLFQAIEHAKAVTRTAREPVDILKVGLYTRSYRTCGTT